jgi:excisionase family DNA binding protein
MPRIPAEQISAYEHQVAHSIPGVTRATTIGRTAIYRAIKRGELKTRKFGRRTLVLDEDLRAWLHSMPAATEA